MRAIHIFFLTDLLDLDPSAAPPTHFRLASVKFGWRAGANRRAVENSAPTFSGGGAARVGATQSTLKYAVNAVGLLFNIDA